jgi:hypothetical protein
MTPTVAPTVFVIHHVAGLRGEAMRGTPAGMDSILGATL